MKSYTDIEQSKKLVEFLPLESADMHWQYIEEDNGQLQWFCLPKDLSINQHKPVLAWSLAALLNYIKNKCDYFELVYLSSTIDGRANILKNVYRLSTDIYDVYAKEAIDACVELIIKLHEQKIL